MAKENSIRRKPLRVFHTPLPPLEEYVEQLRRIWETHWVTNGGSLVEELEHRLQNLLDVPEVCYVSSGTIALQLAIKALDLSGEVITTPFSYVATAGSLLWQGCSPVFVDVRKQDLTIDPSLIEHAITKRTTAILATHIYGFPCDVEALEDIAVRHHLKILYDAAHTFGCKLNSRSLSTYGDAACLSFHATKVFHTVEGGAVISRNETTARNVRLMRAFGHEDDNHYCVGINGKNSEFHAAMGLCNLRRLDSLIESRKQLHQTYFRLLQTSPIRVLRSNAARFEYNYSYFPILLPTENALHQAQEALARIDVLPRRYFYPALNRIPYLSGASCPIAEDAAARVLCLPLSELVTADIQEEIAATLLSVCSKLP